MNLVVPIPDEIAQSLGGDLERQALEGLALEAYRAGRLTKAELRRMLGLQRLEVDAFLKAHAVYDPYTLQDLERERATFERLGL